MKSTRLPEENLQADLEDRFSKVNLALHRLDNRFETKDIHDFRVEVKKLKALIRLFNSAAPDSSLCRFPKQLNKIYKGLGHLREWQIQQIKMIEACSERNFSQPLSYINKIIRKTALHRRKIGELLNPLPQIEKDKEEIKSLLPHNIPAALKQAFVYKKMKNIHELLMSGVNDDESLHYMRKMLKDAQYTLSGAEKEFKTIEGSSRLKTIQTVSGKLGELHDLHVALCLLNRELKTVKKKTEEKTLLRKIRIAWQFEKEKIRQEVLKSLKEVDSSIFHESYPDFIK